MRKLHTLVLAALAVAAVTSAQASYLSSADTANNTLTRTRAASLAQFERAQPAAALSRTVAAKPAAAPAEQRVATSASAFAAPNLARAQGRVAYLRALASGDVAAAGYDFGTSLQYQRATR